MSKYQKALDKVQDRYWEMYIDYSRVREKPNGEKYAVIHDNQHTGFNELQEAVEKANKYDNIIDNVKKDIENIKENTSNLDVNPLRKIGVEILENVLEYGRRK